MIVDGVDGRVHYATVAGTVDLSTLHKGSIVEIRGTDTRAADRTIAEVARSGPSRTSAIRKGNFPREVFKDARIRSIPKSRLLVNSVGQVDFPP